MNKLNIFFKIIHKSINNLNGNAIQDFELCFSTIDVIDNKLIEEVFGKECTAVDYSKIDLENFEDNKVTRQILREFRYFKKNHKFKFDFCMDIKYGTAETIRGDKIKGYLIIFEMFDIDEPFGKAPFFIEEKNFKIFNLKERKNESNGFSKKT